MKTKDEVQKEAGDEIDKHFRCSVALSMGVGKTLLALKHMKRNYTDSSIFLIVIPKNSNINNWRQEAIKHNMNYLIPHMEFVTYRSLPKSSINLYDVVYLDECHNLLESHEEILSQYINKIVGLTGTPPKIKSGKKYKLIDEFCPIVYSYLVDEAVEDKILNNYIVKICYLDLDKKRNLQKTTKAGKVWYTSEKESYDFWTKSIDGTDNQKVLQKLRIMRMKEMQGFKSKTRLAKLLSDEIMKKHQKCIVFCNTKDQADEICKDSYHSSNVNSEDNLKKFNLGEINKLSCVLQLSEGINIKDLDSGIIMHAYSNEIKLSQRLGRLLRLNTNKIATVYILVYRNTVDEIWTNNALQTLNPTKVEYLNF
jgi:superfamily II DNA or RNA helicase